MKFVLRPAAAADVQRRIEWYELDAGREIAEDFLHHVHLCIEAIRTTPRRFPVIDAEIQLRRSPMRGPFRAYTIHYRIVRDTLIITGVYHSRQRSTLRR